MKLNKTYFKIIFNIKGAEKFKKLPPKNLQKKWLQLTLQADMQEEEMYGKKIDLEMENLI